jgi:hypothetical protein
MLSMSRTVVPVLALGALTVSMPSMLGPVESYAADPVACQLRFVLQDEVTLGALQFGLDYSQSAGAILGSAGTASCVSTLPSSLASFNDDDGSQSLLWGAIGLDSIQGPTTIGVCDFESPTAPIASQLLVTELDSASLDVDGSNTQVCGAPETGASPPYARDAMVVLKTAVGHMTTCDECECDVNLSGSISASDSLVVLRNSVGLAAVSPMTCEACLGGASSSPPSEAVTVAAQLDCVFTCPPAPDPACGTGLKSSLTISNKDDNSRDSISWKLGSGPTTTQLDLGDPTAFTTYTVCIYDSVSGADSLVSTLTVPDGEGWRNKDPKGVQYKGSAAGPAGVTKLAVKTSNATANSSKLSLKAKGAVIPMPAPASAEKFFNMDSRVVVQLHTEAYSGCWSSEFSAAGTNTPAKFAAKTP